MNSLSPDMMADRYGRCIAASKRVRWDIDSDVIDGRKFDLSQKFLPDGLTLLDAFAHLSRDEQRLVSQIQGRTYANMFGLVERYINAKILELSKDYWFQDQVSLEALIRFSDEEMKHQELFRRVELMMAEVMPAGYRFDIDPNGVAHAVLSKSTWAVLALTFHIELFTQLHYRQSVEPDAELSELFKDVLLYHWKEESQHATLDELEWRKCDAAISPMERDQAVDQFIELVGAVDGILQMQAMADAAYFAEVCGRPLSSGEAPAMSAAFLKAYRWQYILSGAAHPRFLDVLGGMITAAQAQRIQQALSTLQ